MSVPGKRGYRTSGYWNALVSWWESRPLHYFVQSQTAVLALCHFLGHVQNQLAVAFFGLAQQTPKFAEIAAFLSGAAPRVVVRGLSLQEVRKLWRLFTVVEELVDWDF